MPLPVRRALLSVSDKTGVLELARTLAARGIELLSTGGTARLLAEHGIAVTEVARHTGFPEIMDGRLKTLHPKIHGGLLGRRGTDEAVMAEHAIAPIDLLVVNLYPFAATIARPGCTYEEAVENIDIGGPAMLRAAAKNHAHVLVVVDPADYEPLLAELSAHGGGSEFATRARLAAKAFAHTARYDTMVAAYLAARHPDGAAGFPQTLPLVYEKIQELRYGENPHQRAAFYREPSARGAGIATARVLQGKDLSYNNIADADTAIECVRQFAQPACVIVKHANPCGVAVSGFDRRSLRERLPHRPDLGLRRHHRLQPRARCRDRCGHHRAPVRRSAGGARRVCARRRGARRPCQRTRPGARGPWQRCRQRARAAQRDRRPAAARARPCRPR